MTSKYPVTLHFDNAQQASLFLLRARRLLEKPTPATPEILSKAVIAGCKGIASPLSPSGAVCHNLKLTKNLAHYGTTEFNKRFRYGVFDADGDLIAEGESMGEFTNLAPGQTILPRY